MLAALSVRSAELTGVDALHQRMKVIDWDARVFTVDDFVTDAEADELKEMGHTVLTQQFGDSWRAGQLYSSVFFGEEQYAQHKLVREFEDRVQRLLMVKNHDDEAPLMFTRQIPGGWEGGWVGG